MVLFLVKKLSRACSQKRIFSVICLQPSAEIEVLNAMPTQSSKKFHLDNYQDYLTTEPAFCQMLVSFRAFPLFVTSVSPF